MNIACIAGNLTKDAELRQTRGGMAVASFSVAVNDRRKNQQTGEWEDYPNYIDVTLFGKRAETLAVRLNKGVKVAVQGKLRQSRWQSQDGGSRSKIEIIADDVDLMPRGESRPSQPQEVEPVLLDFDLPF